MDKWNLLVLLDEMVVNSDSVIANLRKKIELEYSKGKNKYLIYDILKTVLILLGVFVVVTSFILMTREIGLELMAIYSGTLVDYKLGMPLVLYTIIFSISLVVTITLLRYKNSRDLRVEEYIRKIRSVEKGKRDVEVFKMMIEGNTEVVRDESIEWSGEDMDAESIEFLLRNDPDKLIKSYRGSVEDIKEEYNIVDYDEGFEDEDQRIDFNADEELTRDITDLTEEIISESNDGEADYPVDDGIKEEKIDIEEEITDEYIDPEDKEESTIQSEDIDDEVEEKQN